MTYNILEKIKTYKLAEIAQDKTRKSWQSVYDEAQSMPPAKPFVNALTKARHSGYGLIAEIKRASPSKGLIRSDFDPSSLAVDYSRGGATCLSVLTDTPSFCGHKSHLKAVRESCDLPILRKDFMFDPYQVAEARSLGADCILIILAAVSDRQAAELEATASELGMDSLIEVHDRAEIERSRDLSSNLIGINNRNLRTFKTTLETTRCLSRHIAAEKIVVAESGLNDSHDLVDLARYGVRCFLIGESLMRQKDVAAATRQILKDPVPIEVAQ